MLESYRRPAEIQNLKVLVDFTPPTEPVSVSLVSESSPTTAPEPGADRRTALCVEWKTCRAYLKRGRGLAGDDDANDPAESVDGSDRVRRQVSPRHYVSRPGQPPGQDVPAPGTRWTSGVCLLARQP